MGRPGGIFSLGRTERVGQKGWEDGGYGENRMDGNVEGERVLKQRNDY